jgi:MFS family permease
MPSEMPLATAGTRERPAETVHRRRWWTLAVLCLSLLLITIDTSIVNTALPTLALELEADSSELLWIVDAYTLPFAGLLLLAGALGTATGATACSSSA